MSEEISVGVLKSAAQAGNSDAQYALASRYRQGDGVETDLCAARLWLSRAAEQGHSDGQNDFGSMLVNGMGGPKDAKVAAIWYERAAEQGNAEAQFNLALRYLHGDGVEEDASEAAVWLWRAVEQHHVEATCELGTLFRFGRGVSQSYKVAGYLHLQAAKGGDPVAHGNLSDYHHEIAALARAGDLQSALVIAEINAAGIGMDKDPVEGLAWTLAVGTPDLPFQEDDDTERQQHGELLSRLTSELSTEEHSAAQRRCTVLLAHLNDLPTQVVQPGTEGHAIVKYDYIDKDGLVLRTPHRADPVEFGFSGFEASTRTGWKPYAGMCCDVIDKGCPVTKAEAKNTVLSLGFPWSD